MSAHLATSLTSILTDSLSGFESFVSGRILIWLLIAAGAYLTVCTRGVQLRLLARSVALVAHSRHQRGSLSSFQAFVIGLGGRVGTGNIAGVALAVTLGGPGALLWMWVVALLGMAFAAMLVFSYGLIFPMVQSNTIAVTVASSHGVATWVTALVLMTVTAPILLAGMRAVAKVTEWLVPVMALAYVAVVAVVIIVSAPRVPGVLADVVAGAFNLRAGLLLRRGVQFASVLSRERG